VVLVAGIAAVVAGIAAVAADTGLEADLFAADTVVGRQAVPVAGRQVVVVLAWLEVVAGTRVVVAPCRVRVLQPEGSQTV